MAFGSGGHQPNATERIDYEPSPLIRTGTNTGGRSNLRVPTALDDRETLKRRQRRPTTPSGQTRRARILLSLDAGSSPTSETL